MKSILFFIRVLFLLSVLNCASAEIFETVEEINTETTQNPDFNNETTTVDDNVTSFFQDFNFTTYIEVTKIQTRRVIKTFEEYRAEIALGSAVLVASVFAISMILSGVFFNRMKKSKDQAKMLEKKKRALAFPKDTDMEVNAVLSIYRAKKIEIQAVNNGKASTHRYDEGTDDDEVIYEYSGKSKIIDFEVVNPVYFVDGSYEAKLEEKQKN